MQKQPSVVARSDAGAPSTISSVFSLAFATAKGT
jgi:hypothetical protein